MFPVVNATIISENYCRENFYPILTFGKTPSGSNCDTSKVESVVDEYIPDWSRTISQVIALSVLGGVLSFVIRRK